VSTGRVTVRIEARDLCIPNIGPRERRRRLIGGAVSLALGVIAAALLLGFGAQRAWRIVVFLPVWAGALGLFQAKERTCVALAARAVQNMDGGDEAINDPLVLAQMRRQARRVHTRTIVLAVLVTAAILAV
jgi:hypothetical protein